MTMLEIYLLAHSIKEDCFKRHKCVDCKYEKTNDNIFPCNSCGVNACFFDKKTVEQMKQERRD